MKTTNRIIKYFAIGLAACLIVTIFSSMAYAIYGIVQFFDSGFVFDSDFDFGDAVELKSQTFEKDSIKQLDIDIAATNLVIKNGDELKAETDGENIYYEVKGSSLCIREKRKSWFDTHGLGKIVLYVPDTLVFDEVVINTGAGKIQAQNLQCERFDLEVGAGSADFDKLDVKKDASVQLGAGTIAVNSGSIDKLDLEIGAGRTVFSAAITGSADAEVGVGSLAFKLVGGADDYTVSAQKGLGSISVDGEQINGDTNIGQGLVLIDVENGIGNISVDFVK